MDESGDLTVVCVDPDPDELAATVEAVGAEPDLTALGFEDGEAALESVEARDVDCLIASHDLDDRTGLDLSS